MEKSLKERIFELKKEQGIAYVYFLSNGTIGTEKYSNKDALTKYKTETSINSVKNFIISASQSYVRQFDFNSISLDMLFGLVYKKEDVDDNNKVKFNRKAIEDIVRYQTRSINTFLDGKQTNTYDYGHELYGDCGYVNYNEFVRAINEEGLIFNGPRTFDEFVEAMSSNQTFDTNIQIDLLEKENNKKLFLK